jgi:ATPase subunit of ABC transporter with duplicated ATPase domains
MTPININALGVTMGDALFSDLNLTISRGDRIGLVAANGQGKSTLMGCIAGSVAPTTGDITRARGLRVGHVAQNVPTDAMAQTSLAPCHPIRRPLRAGGWMSCLTTS